MADEPTRQCTSRSEVPPHGERLDSWKEIAAYLRRGARTVQRWEHELGLPVHRLKHDKLGSVHAYGSELDAWWKSRAAAIENETSPALEERSIAVLPFADMSREKDQEYFCEGIAEEIIGALSRICGLRVASRISAFRFRPGIADVCEAGKKLHVRVVLEGSVRKADGRLRIGVRLSNCETGYQIWSKTFDREMEDVFAIQQEIARSVATALELQLGPKDHAALQTTPTSNIQAYDCYLRGRKYFYGFGTRDMDFAIRLFTRAIGLDPNYVPAYAGLADCWSYIYLYSKRDEAVRQQAEWAGTRAVELDPDSAQAHTSLALALSLGGRDQEAREAFETALRLDPGLFETYYFYARHCFAKGDRANAVRLYEQAMRVRPEDYQSPLLMAQSYDDLGCPEQARRTRILGVNAAEEHLALNPDDARAMYMAANGMVALGDIERGKDLAGRALALRPDDPMLLYNVGCIYSMMGCPDEALGCLEEAADGGVTQRGWYENDNNLEPLRNNPRFQALVARLP